MPSVKLAIHIDGKTLKVPIVCHPHPARSPSAAEVDSTLIEFDGTIPKWSKNLSVLGDLLLESTRARGSSADRAQRALFSAVTEISQQLPGEISLEIDER